MRLLVFTFIYILFSVFTSSAQGTLNEKLFQAKILVPANTFTDHVEGPAVDKDGNLYAVNIDHNGTVGKITPDGKFFIFLELPAGRIGNGIRFNSLGQMLVADLARHAILKVDMNTKEVSILATNPDMSEPNDLAIDKKDRVFASDPNWKSNTGRIWRIDADGKITLLDNTAGSVNGIEVSPDNKILYVNFQKKIWAYDINKSGMLVNKRDIIEFTDYGMDGMRCDNEGNIFVARYGKGTVAKVSPTGIVLQEIKLSGSRPTNIAFGGADGKTVYVTLQDQGNIETFRTDIPGREWQMQKDYGKGILSKIKL